MTRPRARALHKSGQNGKSGSGDTIGIRVPSEDALRKIAFNVASASGGRSKKNAQARKIRRGTREREADGKRERQRGMKIRDERYGRRRWRISKKRTTMRNRDNKRGNVGTLLIENSSALAILIKSQKSLARSIGQTRKARSVGSPFGNGHSQRAHFTLFPPFAPRLSSYYSKYLNRSLRKRHKSIIFYMNGLVEIFIFYITNLKLCVD